MQIKTKIDIYISPIRLAKIQNFSPTMLVSLQGWWDYPLVELQWRTELQMTNPNNL